MAEEKASSVADRPKVIEAIVEELQARASRLESRCEVKDFRCQFAQPKDFGLWW